MKISVQTGCDDCPFSRDESEDGYMFYCSALRKSAVSSDTEPNGFGVGVLNGCPLISGEVTVYKKPTK